MAAGPPPRPVRNDPELIAALRAGDAGATDDLLDRVAEQPAAADRQRLLSLLSQLKDESERLLMSDPAAAERLANALVEAAEHAAEPRFVALGWMAQGDALRVKGRFPEAIALYDRAGARCLELGDEVGWARSRTGFVFASHFAGQGRQALPVGERAYVVLAAAGEHLRAGSLSNNMATVCYQLGEYARALELYDRAVGHFEHVRSTQPELATVAEERVAKAVANKALVLVLLGRFDEALDLCLRARQMFAGLGEVASALRVDHFRASIYAGRGQYTRALRVQSEALAEFERAGLNESSIDVALDMVACQAGLNRHRDALLLAQELAARCQAMGTPTEAARARFRGAQALVALGRTREALEELEAAAEVLSVAGLAAELGAVTLLRARLQLAEADWAAAAALAERACALFTERGLAERRAQAQLVRAQAALALGEPAQADELARAALATSHELDALLLSHAAHHVLARVAERQHRPRRALDEYEASVRDLEAIQSSLTTELRAEFLGDKLRLFQDAIDCSLAHSEPERAFGYLERAKSRALVDYLTSTPRIRVQAATPGERALGDELAALRREHAWFYGRLHGYGAASQDQPLADAERGMLRQAVAERERRIVAIQERLALLRDAQRLEALAPAPAVRPPKPPSLSPGTLLVEYAWWDDRGVAFVISPGGLEVVPLTIGSVGLRRLLGRWQLTLESAAQAVRAGQPLERLVHSTRGQLAGLYRALLGPLAERLRQAERLIVVPSGAAHGVPFHALHDGEGYLTERLEVWTSPSSTLLDLCARRARPRGGRPLVVGYSSGGLLPYANEEAARVAALLDGTCYLEAEATRAAVLAEASRRPIVHLAAHAEARLDNPVFAHITLADGQLGMADVFTLRLDGALVTLSGCETGRGAVVGGDELVGLSRGFLFAGASTLVQSLWRVEDRSTARLMEAFYTQLGLGAAPGAALRHAQRSLLDAGAHPYLWAPFQLVGYGGPAAPEVDERLDAPRWQTWQHSEPEVAAP